MRHVKIMVSVASGLNIKIRFEAKSCAAAAEYTLKTFEGFVFKAFVYCHRVWPTSCHELLCPNPVYDERISLSHEHRRLMNHCFINQQGTYLLHFCHG